MTITVAKLTTSIIIMASAMRAPKQWLLTKKETINTYETWRQNLMYVLSLDRSFTPFLAEGFSWEKKTAANVNARLPGPLRHPKPRELCKCP